MFKNYSFDFTLVQYIISPSSELNSSPPKGHFGANGDTVDPPRKGHCIKYLSTMDKTKSPNLSLPINIMRLEPLKRGQPL